MISILCMHLDNSHVSKGRRRNRHLGDLASTVHNVKGVVTAYLFTLVIVGAETVTP